MTGTVNDAAGLLILLRLQPLNWDTCTGLQGLNWSGVAVWPCEWRGGSASGLSCTAPLSGGSVLQTQSQCAGRHLETERQLDTRSLVAEEAELCTCAPDTWTSSEAPTDAGRRAEPPDSERGGSLVLGAAKNLMGRSSHHDCRPSAFCSSVGERRCCSWELRWLVERRREGEESDPFKIKLNEKTGTV